MKKVLALILVLTMAMSLVGCGSDTETETKTETTTDGGSSEVEAQTLKLAHNLNEEHTVHLALVDFANRVEEKSNGSVKVDIFPNGQLGSESEVLEQLQAGAVSMTKVSAAALTSYDNGYNAFTLPYVFVNEEHYFECMNSSAVEDLYANTKDNGFMGLTFYNSGARSFYTVDKPILHPDDLAGVKIRVMGFQSQTDMVEALGGTPVGLAYGEVYTSIQSGVIDGAESNETALTNGKHGEVAKVFSYDEHTRIPDILVISSKIWDGLSEEQQTAVKEAAKESTDYHKGIWATAIDEAIEDAKTNMGVEFVEVDKAPFREAVQPMLDKYTSEMPEVKALLDEFKGLE